MTLLWFSIYICYTNVCVTVTTYVTCVCDLFYNWEWHLINFFPKSWCRVEDKLTKYTILPVKQIGKLSYVLHKRMMKKNSLFFQILIDVIVELGSFITRTIITAMPDTFLYFLSVKLGHHRCLIQLIIVYLLSLRMLIFLLIELLYFFSLV